MALENLTLETLSTHFKTYQNEYVKHASTAATACVVHCLWGKNATLCFTATILVTFTFLSKQIQVLTHFDLKAVPQIITALLIPASYYFVPFLAPSVVPALGCSLALSHINREWRLCNIADDTGEEIKKLLQQNGVITKLYEGTKSDIGKLEEELKTCLGITAQIEKIFSIEKKTSQALEENPKIDDQLLKVTDKMQRLATVCQSAASQKQLIERMKTANLVENNLTRMTQECSTRHQELATLTQEITDLKDQLKTVISEMGSQEEELRLQLIDRINC